VGIGGGHFTGRKRRRAAAFLLAVVFMAAGAGGWAARRVPVLTIVNRTRGETLLRRPVFGGFTFATRIRHSVQLTPVYEYYRIEEDGTVMVTGTMLWDLGWGMPSSENARVRLEGGAIRLENMDRLIGTLRFRVNHIAEPFLFLGERSLDLRSYAGDGDLLILNAPLEPRAFFLFGGTVDAFQEKTETGTDPGRKITGIAGSV